MTEPSMEKKVLIFSKKVGIGKYLYKNMLAAINTRKTII